MCGFVFTTNHGVAKVALQKQLHRGPDGFRIWKDDTVAIAHALLDISGARQFQPYVTPAGNILAFNGEMFDSPIENDTEWLAKGLDAYGFPFVQNTDWSLHQRGAIRVLGPTHHDTPHTPWIFVFQVPEQAHS